MQITFTVRRLGMGDWVADPVRKPEGCVRLYPGRDYDLQLLPELDPRSRSIASEDIEQLHWLIYPGLWGDRPLFSIGGSGPKGPLWHGLKSETPFAWVRRKCVPDDIYSP